MKRRTGVILFFAYIGLVLLSVVAAAALRGCSGPQHPPARPSYLP